MKISVWDTYVKRVDGKVMHFDILVPSEFKDEAKIFEYGNYYLSTKHFKTDSITSKECRFCHIESPSTEIVQQIKKDGYAIIEMENCD
ncbi:MAG: DUF2024 family protein [Flavipsychrobacter sp.]